jgi:hypothetical protein
MNKEQRDKLKRLVSDANVLEYGLMVVDVPDVVSLLASLEAAEAENGRLRMALKPDMFWNWDDSERNYGGIDEFLSDEYSNGCLEVGARFRMQRAARLPDSYIEVTAIDDESGDATYIESDKAMEAK